MPGLRAESILRNRRLIGIPDGGSPEPAVVSQLALMTSQPIEPKRDGCLELPVEEFLRRAPPLPSHAQMAIDDLTEDEGTASLAALGD